MGLLYLLIFHNITLGLFSSQRWNIVNNGMWAGCVITGEFTMYSIYIHCVIRE